jgi:hypothetical protein
VQSSESIGRFGASARQKQTPGAQEKRNANARAAGVLSRPVQASPGYVGVLLLFCCGARKNKHPKEEKEEQVSSRNKNKRELAKA